MVVTAVYWKNNCHFVCFGKESPVSAQENNLFHAERQYHSSMDCMVTLKPIRQTRTIAAQHRQQRKWILVWWTQKKNSNSFTLEHKRHTRFLLHCMSTMHKAVPRTASFNSCNYNWNKPLRLIIVTKNESTYHINKRNRMWHYINPCKIHGSFTTVKYLHEQYVTQLILWHISLKRKITNIDWHIHSEASNHTALNPNTDRIWTKPQLQWELTKITLHLKW